MFWERQEGTNTGMWGRERLRFYAVLAVMLGLNLWQGYAMELCHDEAYYWLYSRFLDWGYFDHPPMVAATIAVGYGLLSNELGVRIVFILMQTVTVMLVWKMAGEQDALLFWVLVLSFPLFQVGGILALPDMPLVLFSTVFLLAVRRYLAKDDWLSTGALSLSAALVLYSKYHGALVLLLTALAVPGLMRRRTFWVATACAAAMLVPHILWQVDHGLVSVRFQLQRAPDLLNGRLILEYVIGQIGSAGILSGAVLFYIVFVRSKSADAFQRVLRFNSVGVFVFFLVMSLRGKVEANWTQTAFVPLALIGHMHLRHMAHLRKWTLRLALIPIAGIFIVRGLFLFPPEDSHHLRRTYEFSNWAGITGEIQGYADGLPLVAETYPVASSLSFYSGTLVPALNLRSRENQFTLWQLESDLLHEKVCFVSSFPVPGAYMIEPKTGGRLYLMKGLTVEEIKSRF